MGKFTSDEIKKSYLKLLNLRPVNKITVRDIADDCGINRNTFYYHFADLPTLLEDMIEEQAEEIVDSPGVGGARDGRPLRRPGLLRLQAH